MGADTAAWNNETLTDALLDQVTHGSGTSDPNPFPTNRPFYREDLGKWKYTSDGGSTWHFIGGVGEEASSEAGSGTTDITTTQLNFSDDITLPTDADAYIITAIGWYNGTSVAGNTLAGVALLSDNDPPTDAEIVIIGQTAVTANSGTSAEQKTTLAGSVVVGGGTIITPFVTSSTSSQNFQGQSGLTSQNRRKNISFPSVRLPFHDSTAWGTDTRKMKIKVYYKPIE